MDVQVNSGGVGRRTSSKTTIKAEESSQIPLNTSDMVPIRAAKMVLKCDSITTESKQVFTYPEGNSSQAFLRRRLQYKVDLNRCEISSY